MKIVISSLIGALLFVVFAFKWQSNVTALPIEKQNSIVSVNGINFNHMALEAAKKEAKNSGKLIFIDVYTSWCGPCKEMARTTFQSESLGKLYNKKFINLKVDAENDADGPAIAKKYSVSVYPTLLFLNAEGKLLKKLVGKQSEEKLASVAENL
jgi:thiol:disulfide interchange protein